MEEMLLKEIRRINSQMVDMDPATDEYAKLMNRVTELSKLLTDEVHRQSQLKEREIEELKVKKENGINVNDIIGAATNLLGIGLILNHEKLNVISTKALGFVKKLKF